MARINPVIAPTKLIAFAIATASLAQSPCLHAEATRSDHEALTALVKVGARAGFGVYRIVAAELELKNELSRIEADSHHASLERAATIYNGHIARGMAAASTVDAVTEVVSVGLTYAAATGAGTIPALLTKAAWDYGTDTMVGMMQTDIKNRAAAVLAKDLAAWQEQSGRTLSEFQSMPLEDQLSSLTAQNGALNQLRQSLASDPLALKIATDATFASLQAFDAATLQRLSSNEADISGLVASTRQLSGSIRKLEDRTSALEASVSNLDGRVGQLEGAFAELSKDVSRNAIATGAIGRIVFDSSSPEQKMHLLQSGALGDLSPEQVSNLEVVIQSEALRRDVIQNCEIRLILRLSG